MKLSKSPINRLAVLICYTVKNLLQKILRYSLLLYFAAMSSQTLAQKATAPNLEVLASIEFDGTAPFSSPNSTDDANDGSHVPGEDERDDNNVVRTFDSVGYRVDYNVNELDATNVQISATLPVGVTWVEVPPGCDVAASSISADERTLVCSLGDLSEGTSGAVLPIARVGQLQDNDLLSIEFVINSIESAPTTSNQLVTTISATAAWSWVKSAPDILENVDNGGIMGVAFIYPITVEQTLGQRGTAPAAINSTSILFEDHAYGFPDTAILATGLNLGGRSACGGYDGSGGFPFGNIAAPGANAMNTTTGALATESFTCALDSTKSASAGYRVFDINISGHNTNTLPAQNADGSANTKMVGIAGQIALWVSNADLQAAAISNADLENAITSADTTQITRVLDPLLNPPAGIQRIPIDLAPPLGVILPEFGVLNNYLVEPNLFVPVTGGNRTTRTFARFNPGPFIEREYTVTTESKNGSQEPVGGVFREYDYRRSNQGGYDDTGFGDSVGGQTNQTWNGVGEVSRGQNVIVSFGTHNRSDFSIERHLNLCGQIDNRFLRVTDFPDFDRIKVANRRADAATIGSETNISTSNGLAQVYIGGNSPLFGIFGARVAVLTDDSINYVVEFAQAASPADLSNPATVGSIPEDGISCNNDDADADGWIDSSDTAGINAKFDPDGDGFYDNLNLVRLRVIDIQDGLQVDDTFIRGATAHIHLNAEVKDTIATAPAGSKIYSHVSSSYTQTFWDPTVSNGPDIEQTPDRCIQNNRDNPLHLSGSNWCGLQYDEAVEGAGLDNNGVEVTGNNGIVRFSHHDKIIVVEAQPGIRKRNVAGLTDFVDNGDTVVFEVEPFVRGAAIDTLQNVVVTDFLPSQLELISFTQPAFGNVCNANGANTQITCNFGAQSGGFSDSFTVTTRVRNAVAGQVLTNRVRIGATDRSNVEARAFAYMISEAPQFVVRKEVPDLDGNCTNEPGLPGGNGGLTAGDCSLIPVDGNLVYELIYENTGNVPLNSFQIIDVLPHLLDENEAQDSTFNGTPASAGDLGDGRTPESLFNGTTQLVSVVSSGSGTVEYTTNAAANVNRDPALDTSTYTSTISGATAFRYTQTNSLNPGDTVTLTVTLSSANNQQDNIYTNTFGARANELNLQTRSNDVSIMVYEPVSIGSYVWLDANGDGLQGLPATEPAVAGAMVALYRENSTTSAFEQVLTDNSGNAFGGASAGVLTTSTTGLYEFENLPPGNYLVVVLPPAGFQPTPVQDGNDNADSTTAGSNDFQDSNINTSGTLPASLPTGFTPANSFVTGEFQLTPGTEPSELGTQVGDDQDSDSSSDEASGNMSVDIGLIRPVSIGSQVFVDADADGIQDNNAVEGGIPGAVLTLYLSDGSGGFTQVLTDLDGNNVGDGAGAAGTITTGAGGTYLFDNLPPGDYQIRVDPPAGLGTPSAATQQSGTNNDTENDSNVAGEIGSSGVYFSPTFTLASGAEPAESGVLAGDNADNNGVLGTGSLDTDGNMTVDFGFIAPVSIGSFIWNDADGDGVQDAGEAGIQNAVVALLVEDPNNAGVFIAATDLTGATVTDVTTGVDGLYEFDNLPPGNYKVRVTPPAGFEPTPVQDGANNSDATPADELDSNINTTATGVPAGTYESGEFTLTSGGEPQESDAAAGDNQDGTSGSNTDLSGNNTIDFGFVQPVSIGSFIWEDLNVDGVQDAGEPAIENATVALLVDNGSGTFIAATDMDGNTVMNITTGANGQYEFDNLPPGDYRVRVTPPSGFVPTPTQDGANNSDTVPGDELDSNIDTAATGLPAGTFESGTFTLISLGEPQEADTANGDGQDGTAGSNEDLSGNMTVDFGFVAPMSLGSFVWQDTDGDGVQDAGEPGIANAVVALLVDNGSGTFVPATDITGTLITNVITGADGLYEFDNLPPGDYRVRVTPPVGFEATPVQDGANNSDTTAADELDSNINTAATSVPAGTFESGTFTLSSGGEPLESDAAAGDAQDDTQGGAGDLNGNNTIDFGFIAPVSIGSFIWNDADGDGVQDAGEAGIQNAVVALLVEDPNNAGVFIAATDLTGATVTNVTTGVDGLYEFDNLPPGNYKVRVTPPAGFEPTPVQDGADNSDTQASDELDSNINTAATGVPAGTYESGEFTLTSGGEPQESDAAAGDNQDGTSGSNTDLSGNNTIDFGFVQPVSIGSFIWEDLNVDGVQDAGEPGVSGVTLSLVVENGSGVFVPAVDINGDPVTNVVTGADGLYEFDDLPPGNYRVRLVPPAGFEPSPVQDGGNNSDTTSADELDSNINTAATGLPADTFESGTFTLTSLGEPSESDTAAGDVQDGTAGSNSDLSGNNTIDFGLVSPVSLGSFIWNDLNGDGIQQANEPPIGGALVTLLVDDGTGTGILIPATDINGTAVSAITTGANGLYNFENLPNGDYVVEVTVPDGFAPSPVQTLNPNDDTENDSNIAEDLGSNVYRSAPITLDSFTEPVERGTFPGDALDGTLAEDVNGNMTLDFGFVELASLGNRVWLDLDMDGVQDANEEGIANVTVNLYEDTDGNGVIDGAELTTPVATVTTGPNGEYVFTELMPGVAYISGVDVTTLPVGLEQTFDEGDGVGATDSLSDPIVLEPREFHETADFGYAPPAGLGAIGDTIWVDADDDGNQDPGEPGISGVTVTLTPPPDVDLGNGLGVAITTVTDENGKYLFLNLPVDENYIVEVDITTLPPGYTASSSGLGDPDVRDGNSAPSEADNQTIVVLTTAAPINLDADFGYLPDPGQNNSVGNTLWIDVDEDGNGPAGAGDGSDANERPLSGVTVALEDVLTGAVIATTITDANGQYFFTGIPDGMYEVRVTDQNNVLAGLDPTSDGDDPANPGAFVAITPNVSLVDLDSAGGSPTPVVDLAQDFGYVDSTTNAGNGTIGDTIFFDANYSGFPEPGEGIEGVTVQLFDPGPDGILGNGDDVLIGSTQTDENGNYLFTGLDTSDTGPNPGTDYRVVVVTSTLPNGGDGWTNSVDPDTAGTGDSESVTTLTGANPTDLDQDFGYVSEDNNSLSGTVWPDTDGDGELAEAGRFGGVTIELRDEDGNVIQSTETDSNGDYQFVNLPDGVYVVVVTDEGNVLNGYEHTDSPNGASDTSDLTSKDDTGYRVDLDSAGLINTPVSDVTGDFGYQPVITNPISLGSFESQASGDGVLLRWTTQTEVANLGFYLYERVDDEWVRLNDELILGQGDSIELQRYEINVSTDAQAFALSDVDLEGKETIHGPFLLGQTYGVVAKRRSIDWAAERSERSSKEAKRAKRKREQQRQRSLKLKKSQQFKASVLQEDAA